MAKHKFGARSLPLEGGGLGWGCGNEAPWPGSRKKVLTKISRKLRKERTPAEDKFRKIVSSKQLGGYKFRLQHVKMVKKDAKRTDFLEKEGHRIFRVWNNELFDNPGGVAEAVLYLLENPTAHPSMFSSNNNNETLSKLLVTPTLTPWTRKNDAYASFFRAPSPQGGGNVPRTEVVQ